MWRCLYIICKCQSVSKRALFACHFDYVHWEINLDTTFTIDLVSMCACVCACVCVRKREREREGDQEAVMAVPSDTGEIFESASWGLWLNSRLLVFLCESVCMQVWDVPACVHNQSAVVWKKSHVRIYCGKGQSLTLMSVVCELIYYKYVRISLFFSVNTPYALNPNPNLC